MPRRRTSSTPGSLGYGFDPSELNPLEAQAAKEAAIQAATNDEVFKRGQQMELQKAQGEDRQQALLNDLKKSYAQHVAASQMAPPIEPTLLSTNDTATDYTMRPAGTPTDQMLARMDPNSRMKAQQELDAMSLARRKQAESEAASQGELDLKNKALNETIRKNQFDEGGQDVSANVKTTLSGKTYLDLGDYQTPTAKEAARRRAQALGIKAVSPDVGSSLSAADTARQNINAMWAQIESKLPKDPTGRIVGGPANKLSQVFQTDSDLAAFNSWRAGAIQAVQALVEKGMGFRLNQAEINMIMQNDMPQITDTVQTAKRRVDNVLTLLQNKENSALTQDRSSLPSGSTPAAPRKIGKYQVEIH